MDRTWVPYCGAAPVPAEWLARWNFDPLLILVLAAGGALALRKADSRALVGLSLACLALLFLSPLCALSSALFSVRVTHHVALTAIAAPLLVLGLRLSVRGGAPLWAVVHILFFWLWHAPAPYAFALGGDAAYWTMQASLFASAVGLWAALRRAPGPLAIGLLLVMTVQMGLLGALITFAGAPLYAPHLLATQPWGLTPLEDQQLAGLVMWAPAAAFYLAAALWAGWRLLPPQGVPR